MSATAAVGIQELGKFFEELVALDGLDLRIEPGTVSP